MHTIIFWVLIIPGVQPTSESYPTHAECTQAKYDYNRIFTNQDKKQKRILADCRPRFKQVGPSLDTR